jgi:hypothetical protein
MKLPDFSGDPLLNQLRADMGAQIVNVPSRARARLLNPEAVLALGRPAQTPITTKPGSAAPSGVGARATSPNLPSQYARNAGSRILTPIPDKESSQ